MWWIVLLAILLPLGGIWIAIARRYRGAPGPLPDVHPDDLDLMRPEDSKWWMSTPFRLVLDLLKQDDVMKYVAYRNAVERKGWSEEEGLDFIERQFPTYYLQIEDREYPPNLLGERAKLPIMLKNRVTRRLHGAISPEEISASSSMNALIRKAIRAGRL